MPRLAPAMDAGRADFVAAQRGPDYGPHAVADLAQRFDAQAGIFHRLHRGDYGELGRSAHAPRLFARNVVRGIEAAHFAADPHIEVRCFDILQFADAGFPGLYSGPEVGLFAPKGETMPKPVITTRLRPLRVNFIV